MNITMITGNLGKDPEIRQTQSGDTTAKFSVAAKDFSDTEWFNVVCFKGQARYAEAYLKKGSKVAITGRMKTSSWEGQDGQTKYRTELLANSVEGMDPKPSPPDRQVPRQDTIEDEIPF